MCPTISLIQTLHFARRFVALLACLIVIGSCVSSLMAQQDRNSKLAETKSRPQKKKKTDSERFIRVRRDKENRAVALETSIIRYFGKNEEGKRIIVDLIGVVHIGEKDYYKKLNQRFAQYDSLLYELVAPKGTRVPRSGRKGGGVNPIAAVQKAMQATLGLEFQLDHIDYQRDNFVHADMSPEEFLESMKNNNESMVKSFFRAMGQSIARQGSASAGTSDAELLRALFSNDHTQLRRAMAEQMKDIESGMLIFEGDNGSTIIHHRNKKALSVMEDEIDKGKQRIGIFYGAGHLPDMEDRLLRDFDMKRAGTVWLSAWALQSKPKPKSSKRRN